MLRYAAGYKVQEVHRTWRIRYCCHKGCCFQDNNSIGIQGCMPVLPVSQIPGIHVLVLSSLYDSVSGNADWRFYCFIFAFAPMHHNSSPTKPDALLSAASLSAGCPLSSN